MKIGYSVEGSTDRALLKGLKERWCPDAELEEGSFRGQTHESRRREIPRICIELVAKDVNLIIFLTDSNGPHWRDVLRAEETRCRTEHRHIAMFGVCCRNVECWLAADADYIANWSGRAVADFRVDDPKGVVGSVFGITRWEKKELEIAEFVRSAPIDHWMHNSSFESLFRRLVEQEQRTRLPDRKPQRALAFREFRQDSSASY